MAKKKSDGAAVRQAMDGPQVDYDELMTHHQKWADGESSDASSAGERREQIGKFAEKCGLENKALSQFRAGMKIKNEGKQRDWLRSMKVLLAMAESAITGNQPDLMPDAPVQTKGAKPVEAEPDDAGAEESSEEAPAEEATDPEPKGGSVTAIDFGGGA